MRFARHATIFRGPLDAAAVASVLFLLVIFMLLASLLYTPGVLIRIADSVMPAAGAVLVTSGNEIVFGGKTNQPSDLDHLRDDLRNFPGKESFALQAQPGASQSLVEKVRALFQVRLPDGDNLVGTDNPTVSVAVNFRGQCFFENKPVQDEELRTVLRRRLQEASQSSKTLTLVLSADSAAENEVVMRLSRLAREVGLKEILLVERPNVFGAPQSRGQP